MKNNNFVDYMKTSARQKKESFIRAITVDSKQTFEKPKWTGISIGLGLLVGMLLVTILSDSHNPFLIITSLLYGMFGTTKNFGLYIGALSWMIPIGLAMVLSFRAGMFNIGAAGQMMAGSIIAYVVAAEMPNTPGVGWIIPVLAGMAAGMILGYIISKLKTRLGINEVLSSIMFNWIIFWNYKLIEDPVWSKYGMYSPPGTYPLENFGKGDNTLKQDWIVDLFNGSSYISSGIFLALTALIVIWFVFKHTGFGQKISVVGHSPTIATAGGIDSKRVINKTMAISGMMAGLAGTIFTLGYVGKLASTQSDIPAQGFQGITIALIGWNSPMGALGGSLFLASLESMTFEIQAQVDKNIVGVIIAIIMILISVSQYFIIYDPIGKRKAKKALQKGGDS